MTRERLSLRAKALSLLAGREYSRMELKRKLMAFERRYAENPADDSNDLPSAQSTANCDIDALLADFEARGWLSDARFVEGASIRLGKRYGPRRVVQALREKGVSVESIDSALPYLQAQALESARSLLVRKFSGPATTQQEKARRVRFLQGRGFDYDVIRKALEPADNDDT